MKKLLVISYLFAPISVIGAIRWTKMSKYLSRMGYEVDVITTSAKAPEDALLIRDSHDVSRIIRIDHKKHKYDQTIYYKDMQTAAVMKEAAVTGKKPLVRRIKDAVWHCAPLKKITSLYVAGQDYDRSRDFAAQVKNYIKNNVDINSYSAVICTYGPVCGTILADWIKKSYPQIPLIMDFRDPMTNSNLPAYYFKKYNRMQLNICRQADRLITVTEGSYNHICGDLYKDKRYVITNGYDPEDFQQIKSMDIPGYSFVYTVGSGGLYGGLINFAPFYKALSELVAEGVIDKKDLVFHHIGNDGKSMIAQADAYGMGDIVKDHGRVPREQALSWQRSARHLTLAVWNNKNSGGILTGKFLEYMLSGRPIIGIITGDTANSTLREKIEKGRLGFACESINGNDDIAALKEYLAADYARWKQGLAPDYQPNTDYINSFSYPARAAKIAEIIEEAGR